MSYQLRQLRKDDLREAARLHRSAFPQFFLSQLGEPFLREFYRGFLSEGSITAIARGEDGRMQGVVVGHIEPTGFFKRLVIRRWYAFAAASISLAVRRPSVIPRLVRALSFRGQGGHTEQAGALLTSICVAPQAESSGLGQTLLDCFKSSVIRLGGTRAFLTTDAENNQRVNDFYVKSGWTLQETFATPENRAMNCYAWSSNDCPNSGDADGAPTQSRKGES